MTKKQKENLASLIAEFRHFKYQGVKLKKVDEIKVADNIAAQALQDIRGAARVMGFKFDFDFYHCSKAMGFIFNAYVNDIKLQYLAPLDKFIL